MMRSEPATPPNSDPDALLAGVSRSFGLSLRLLPAALRPTLSLAYLLARATDTLADALPPLFDDTQGPMGPDGLALTDIDRQSLLADRLSALEELGQLFSLSQPSADAVSALAEPWQEALATRQAFVAKADEKNLLATLPRWLGLWRELPGHDREATGAWMAHILRGQQEDLLRLRDRPPGKLACLADEAALDRYTWWVAGSVGEFWTRLCEQHLADWRALPLTEMQSLGQRYGQGLQRLNILRDTAEDLRDGRCYWPVNDLATLGLSPEDLARAVQSRNLAWLTRMQPLWAAWLGRVRIDLIAGVQYACALHPIRLRIASALPALLGLRTLNAIEAKGLISLCEPVRVPRTAVYGLLMPMLLSLGHPGVLRRLADWANGSMRE